MIPAVFLRVEEIKFDIPSAVLERDLSSLIDTICVVPNPNCDEWYPALSKNSVFEFNVTATPVLDVYSVAVGADDKTIDTAPNPVYFSGTEEAK